MPTTDIALAALRAKLGGADITGTGCTEAPADDWPLPAAEIETAEQLGLVVRPESPAVQDDYPVRDMACPERHALTAGAGR